MPLLPADGRGNALVAENREEFLLRRLGGTFPRKTFDGVVGDEVDFGPQSLRAIGQQSRLVLGGIKASYSAAVALLKTITITYTDCNNAAATLVLVWDFTNGPLLWSFPLPIPCQTATDVTATLTASGTGGTTGSIDLFYFEM